MRNRIAPLVLAFVLLPALAEVSRADVVTGWTTELLDAVRAERPAPPAASRQMAFATVGMFDAVNGVFRNYEPYAADPAGAPGADPEAAAATAAHDLLGVFFPGRAAQFAARLAADLATVPDGPAKSAGIAWGSEVAAALLAARAHDGATSPVAYAAPSGAGWWAPTPPAFQANPVLPHWPKVRPWGVASVEALRPPPPPSLRGVEYAAAYSEVFEVGETASESRSADQTEIALFWADGPGTATPPGHWLEIAVDLALEHGLDLEENARLFARLGAAVADAAIVSWDAKYAYDFWRPVTAIRAADLDGNPATPRRGSWTPLIATPPFPAYTSGHSTFSGAASRILALAFGDDALPFATTSNGLPGVVRDFTSFSAAAEEAGQSRIYGGIHWQFDNQHGLQAGRRLADEVFATRFRERHAAGPCETTVTELCARGRFLVSAAWSLDGIQFEAAHAIADSDESGRFWFFDAQNTELDVKLLDGCGENGRFWIYAAGLTTLDVTLEVTDTTTGTTRRYHRSGGRAFAPIADIEALAGCP